MPPRWIGTAAMPAELSVGVAIPTPRPETKKPGSNAGQLADPCTSAAPIRLPTPIRTSPAAMIGPGRMRTRCRPIAADTVNDATVNGSPIRPALMGESPTIDCNQIDVYVNSANAANVSSNAASRMPTNDLLRMSPRSSIAAGECRSTWTNATNSAAPTIQNGHVPAFDQPCSLPWIIAYVTAAAAPVNVTMPYQSTRTCRDSCTSFSTNTLIAIAARLIGRLTKKIQRQEMPSVRRPPMIGPTAAAALTTAPHMP